MPSAPRSTPCQTPHVLARIFYGPRDWLVGHSNARLRGALGFWLDGFCVLTVLTWTDPENLNSPA